MTKVIRLKHQVKYNGRVKSSAGNSEMVKPLQLQQSSHTVEEDKESNSEFAHYLNIQKQTSLLFFNAHIIF